MKLKQDTLRKSAQLTCNEEQEHDFSKMVRMRIKMR